MNAWAPTQDNYSFFLRRSKQRGRLFQIETVLNPDERAKLLILLCIQINDSLQQGPRVASAEPA